VRHTLGLTKSMRCDTQFMRADSVRFGGAIWKYKNDSGGRIPSVGRRIFRMRAKPREAYIKFAETWLESALRAERLAALLERSSKEPTPTTNYEWVLPPFGEWRYKGTSLK